MGSSAQNNSGVHWCRRGVRFNAVPGEGSEGSREGLGGLGAEPGQVKQGSEEGSGKGSGEGLGGFVQSQVRLNRFPEKVLEKVPEKVWEALCRARSG